MFTLIPCKSYDSPTYQLAKDHGNIPPGQLQYKITKNDIMQLEYLTEDENYDSQWVFMSHTEENLNKLIPYTPTGLAYRWKILFIIQNGNCMKGVLHNLTNPDEYALMSSLNEEGSQEYTSRMIKSLHNTHKICQCKMIAPAKFWNELKNRILY